MRGLKVIWVQLQSAVSFPGSEILGVVTLSCDKTKGLEMELTEHGLIVKTNLLTGRGKGGIIPHANVKEAIFAMSDYEEAPTTKGKPKVGG